MPHYQPFYLLFACLFVFLSCMLYVLFYHGNLALKHILLFNVYIFILLGNLLFTQFIQTFGFNCDLSVTC